MSSRNWCFTLNNPICPISTNHQAIKTLVATLEVGDQGTMHYQGYIEVTSPRKLEFMMKLIPGAHFEIRRGTRPQAILYVTKTLNLSEITSVSAIGYDEGTYSSNSIQILTSSALPKVITNLSDIDFADLITKCQKKKTATERLAEIQELMNNGAKEIDIAENFFSDWVKYQKSFLRYQLLKSNPRNEPPTVIVIFGPTGTGKSRYCMEQYPDAFWKTRGQWWDGYSNQASVIIDEYYGWLPFDMLLRLCDRYPFQVEVKGGYINFNSNIIIFTSNKAPHEWYTNAYFPAFERRVSKWIIMKEEKVELDTYEYNLFN